MESPDISLEEMMKLIEGFVDILVLSSGYQSSGLPAHWDSNNIKRGFQWALFFENVYQESIQELDAALSKMTSHPSFPQSARFFNRSNAYYLSLSIKSEPMHNGKRCLGRCTFLTKVEKMICTRQLDDEDDSVAKMKTAEEALEAKQKVTNSLSATCSFLFIYHVL
ncbi:uncharacterized protein LOC105781030 isoform X3 [Gossypium raimondii]|uniref:uncharacterized protein LOC105781030 isoform X3 n=1 Tax=Gossypium raimondii TaxID=29730 RepID=UPI00063AD279|nr:uncharacterized protein LOC105781030 isoform X3 [Gossypium raimondii]